jgi:hypothetical protein
MDARKGLEQAGQLLVHGGWMIVLAGAGLRRVWRGGVQPFYAYLGCGLVVLAATAAKVGADLNYQIEVMVAFALCSGWALDQIGFTPRRGWRPSLLELAPVVQLTLNLLLGGMAVHERVNRERVWREEASLLAPYIQRANGPVLSVQLDPLLRLRGRLDVEPLIYTLLADGGLVNPEPVRRDLASYKFPLVILFQDVFAVPPQTLDREIPSLPESHLKVIRNNYRLVGHIPGPYLNGDYLYEPAAAVR